MTTEENDLDRRINERAFQIWIDEGQPTGRSKEHWERARYEITGSSLVTPSGVDAGFETGWSRELFITGLRNAHAMERHAQEMLERQVERLTNYPDLRGRLKEHLVETEEQIRRLEQCLESCDSSTSTFKDVAYAFGANMAAVSHAMADDEVLKHAFADSALENYEIAAYKSLLTMASAAGDNIREALKQSLQEEETMASWLNEHVNEITRQYLRHAQQTSAA
jgi:ferritin-like metal-binding protein YciE